MKPIIQKPLDDLSARCSALEAELAALKRLVLRSSGTIDATIQDLSGSVDSAVRTLTSGGLTFVSTDGTITGQGTAVSPLTAGTLSSSIDSSIRTGDTAVFTSLQAGSSSSIASLSGTVNARFTNFNYSNIAVTGNLTTTADLWVRGSITGSGDVALGRNLLLSSGMAQFGGVNWFSIINYNGDGLQSSFLRGGTTAGKVWIGDVNTGGVFLGSSANRTQALGDLTVSGSVTGSAGLFGGPINMGTNLVNNVKDPAAAQDASTKNYVDRTYSSLSAGSTASILDAQFSGTLAVSFQVFSSSIDQSIVTHGIDPRRSFQLYNDFLNMDEGAVGLEGGGTALIAWSPMHPGILRLNAPLSGNYVYWTPTQAGMSSWAVNFTGGGGRLNFESMVATNGNGTTDQARYQVGIVDTIVGDSSYGIWLENDWLRHSNQQWYICTAFAGSRTKVSMGTGSDPSDWIRLNWEVAANGDVVTGSWYYNNVLQGTGTINTNIPSLGVVSISLAATKQLGSANRKMDVDYFRFWQIFTGSRQ